MHMTTMRTITMLIIPPAAAAVAVALFLLLLVLLPTTVDAAAFLLATETSTTTITATVSSLRLQEQYYWHNQNHHHYQGASLLSSSSTSNSRLYETKNNGNVDIDSRNDAAHRRHHRLVIVGGGIGGLSSAYDARHILKDHNVDIIVVSNLDYFSFTPSNPWIAIRKRQPNDIQLPLHKILPRHNIEFIHAAVTKLEPNQNRIWLHQNSGNNERKQQTCLDYDYLIIATGPRLAFEGIPGLSPTLPITTTTTTTTTTKGTLSAAASSICTTPHALHTAELVDNLQQNPGPIVIGATQGASCFGPAYEFILLLHYELMQRGGMALVDACRPMTFITSEPFIGHLGLNGAGNSRHVMETLFQKYGIEYMTSTRTVRVSSTSVTVERLDEDTGKVLERKVLSSKLTMMSPPFHGHDIWKRVPHLTDDKGLVIVNDYQQNPTYSNIFAVGVAVSIPNTIETLLHCGVPKTGYLIESQGTAAIRNIQTLVQASAVAAADDNKDHENDAIRHVQLHSRPLLNALCITDFGNDGAVFVTLPQNPPRRMDITIHGKIATLAKIAFEKYFLHKIESGDTDPYYEHYMLKLVGIERTLED